MFNAHIYPGDTVAQRRLNCKLPLYTGVSDPTYLDILESELPKFLDDMGDSIALAVYNAGTDVLAGDPLGFMSVSAEGILKRDLFVFETLKERGIPWAMVTSGGYTQESHRIIARTVGEAIDRWGAPDETARTE